jgi:fatty acyl-ACP thioesterase B
MYASGKNGLGRDWIFRDSKTGETLATATRFFLYHCPVN